MKTKIRPQYFLLLPALITFFVLSLGPCLYAIALSFQEYNIREFGQIGTFVGFQNYSELLLRDENFLPSLRVTISIAIPSVLIEFILGILVALLFAAEGIKGRRFLIPLLLIPNILADVVVGLVWLFMLQPTFGVLTQLMNSVGLFTEISPLAEPRLALPVVVVADVWQYTPFVALMFIAGILSLPKDPVESAQIDGASSFQIFRHVTLPALRPLIVVAVLIRSIDLFRLFDKIWVLTGGGPGMATETVAVYAYRTNFRWWDLGYGSALVMMLYVIVLVYCVIFYSRLSK
jgi:multiple sugar transport system permease protein